MSVRTVMSMDATSRQGAPAHAVHGDGPAPGTGARKTLPRSRPAVRVAGGFTLIELLVAVALLAVLAILSWRGLDTVLQSRERLVTESNELRSLTSRKTCCRPGRSTAWVADWFPSGWWSTRAGPAVVPRSR